MLFQQFVTIAELAASTPKKSEKTAVLSAFLRRLEDDELKACVEFFCGRAFPLWDDHKLGTGYSTLWSAIAAASRIKQADFARIYSKYGDLSEAAEEAMRKKAIIGFVSEPLQIKDVRNSFEKMAATNSLDRKKAIVLGLLNRAEPQEAKQLMKIITGESRYGFAEALVEEAIAGAFDVPQDDVRYANMIVSDLGAVALKARKGAAELRKTGITPFRPFRVMLAENAVTIGEALDYHGGRIALEFKFDGARVQLHKEGNKAELYSRSLEKISDSFPELIAAAKAVKDDFIIDGEVVCFEEGKARPFQYLIRRIGRKWEVPRLAKEFPVKLFCFDLLWLNGEQLTDRQYKDRRKQLESLALPEQIRLSESIRPKDAATAQSLFDQAMQDGYEGVMIKSLSSKYVPGKRGKHWFKYKQALESLQLAVIAAEWGNGKRAKVLSDYTFGAWNEAGELMPVAKAYCGLTDKEIEELTKKLLELKVGEAGRMIHVKPEIIMDVASGEIQKSTAYRSGFALRFPRVLSIRWDLGLDDVDDISKITAMYERQRRK
jgi:DNA ligase-1